MRERRLTIISAMIFCIALAVTIAQPNTAAAAPKSISYIAIDVNTGKVLATKNANSLRHPASLTKMMTLYVLFDALEEGQVTMNTRLKVSKNAASKPASKLYLKAGSTITVNEAIDALIVKSANDVATVVAENLSGTETNFARTMTKTARNLGMDKSTFINASGLHDERQVTTAKDMFILGLALQDRFPRMYDRFGKNSFVYRGKRIGGHNPFTGTWRGVDGIKTGYTNASGFNIVSNYNSGRRHILAVVIGADTSAKRNATMRSVLNHSIRKSTSTWRRTAMLDQDLAINTQYATVNVASKGTLVTASLLPRARPGTEDNLSPETKDDLKSTVVAAVAEATRPLPPTKPRLFKDHPNFFARNTEMIVLMVESYDKAYEELQAEQQQMSAGIEPEPKQPRKARRWRADVETYHMNTSNVSYSNDSFETVSCMQSNTCFVSGIVQTKGGHYRVEDSEIFALITSSGG